MRRRTALFVLALLPAAALDCRQATQIELEITSDEPCANVQGTTITVGRIGEIESRPPTASATTCDSGRIGSLVVVPSGANEDDIAIKVVAGIGQDPSLCVPPYGRQCIVARRALRFVPHEDLQLPVRMAAACAGVSCDATQTCVEGVCVDATIPDPTLCTTPAACDLAPTPPSAAVRRKGERRDGELLHDLPRQHALASGEVIASESTCSRWAM
ncbi:MAG TPA: hypothetical protein VIF62_34950 [Labilithrix sp.]|jgi:hypothetical protein